MNNGQNTGLGKEPPMKTNFKWTAGLMVVLTGLLGTAAQAGPPYFTDDPEPVARGHWEYYAASQWTTTALGTSGTAPHFEVNYGATDNMQLHMIVPGAFNHPVGEAIQYGLGDTELGVKYRFVQETDVCPMVGTFPHMEVPTGQYDKALGNGRPEYFAPLWLQKSFGQWTANAGGGVWFNKAARQKNWVYLGGLLQWRIFDALTIGLELFNRSPEAEGRQHGTGFTAGAQVDFSEQLHFLIADGRDFGTANKFTHYMALLWTVGPHAQ